MRQAERYAYLLNYFQRTMPDAASELHFETPFQLLVATILSAQCTDKRVNETTPMLFRVCPDAKSMASFSYDDIHRLISNISYPNAKAKHLVEMAQQLVERHGGEVPVTTAELTALSGVGPKTAAVVQAVAFNIPAMPVDTHVFRVSHRLRLVSPKATTPLKVQEELCRHIPKELLSIAHHWLLLHGRRVCRSRRPACEECGLTTICPSKEA